MDTLMSELVRLVESNFWLAPAIAAIAGFLTSFTPCCLANIPIIIGYVGGIGENNPKRAFSLSLIFALGSTITFMILALIVGSVGEIFNHESNLYHIVIGLLMILMALQTWNVINIFPRIKLRKGKKSGYLGALVTGMIGGAFSTPCSTPMLVVILAFILRQNNIPLGLLLMFMYSAGHNILIIASGTSISFVKKIEGNPKYHKLSNVLRIIFGCLILLIGAIMFYHVFTGVHVH